MRALVVAAVVLGLAGVALTVWWSRGDSAPPHEAPAPHAPPTAASTPQELAAPVERSLGQEHGSLVGTVVDEQQRPIAGARVQMVDDDVRDDLPAASTDARGRFQLPRVPFSVTAVRASANGYAAAQLGDLQLATAPDHHLDLGAIVLPRGTTYQGRVLARGKGIAGVSVVLAADLRAPGQAQPVLQRVFTDEEGWFLFDVAPEPPCRLRAQAPGYREAPAVPVVGTTRSFTFELDPLPRVRGRIVDAASGEPLLAARVQLRPWHGDAPEASLPAPDTHPEPSAVPVADDGTFDLLAPDAPSYVVECFAPEHRAIAQGPFPTQQDVTLPTAVLVRGCVVTGTVTWHGEPIAGAGSLWPEAGPGAAIAIAEIARDGVLRLPPAPPGSWILRVEAEAGATFERRLELAQPGAYPLQVQIPDGTRLVGRVVGEAPPNARVTAWHERGRQQHGVVRADGTFEVDGLFAGRWRAEVFAASDTWASQAHFQLAKLLDDQSFVVDSSPEVHVELAPPGHRLARLRGRVPAPAPGTRVTLVPENDLQSRIPAGLLQCVVAPSGEFSLDPALPGTWRVRWSPPGGTPRDVTCIAVAGQETVCDFPAR